MKRQRRRAESGEYQDPLKNYQPRTYEDELERSLAEDPVTALQIAPYMTVPPTMTVEAALKVMKQLDIACLMVTENDHLVGIFSERDVVTRVAENYSSVRSKAIAEVMTSDPVVVHETDPAGKALNLMAEGGFRHIPVLDVDDKVVGILGPRRVTSYLQKHFA